MLRFTPPSFAALAYLALAGSILAFVAYIYALRHLPVTIVSLYAYINPIIAVALGTWLLGEPFGVRMLVATVVILSGLAVVSTARSRQASARPSAARRESAVPRRDEASSAAL
jgi:drug/metabolite transporter (DMT)-like permease